MARTPIDPQMPLGAYPSLPLDAGSAAILWTADDDPTDRDCAIVEGKTLILAQNTDASPQTITFTSVADQQFHRTGDISAYSIPAGETHMFGPFKKAGWQHGGRLYIDVSDAKVVLANVTLP